MCFVSRVSNGKALRLGFLYREISSHSEVFVRRTALFAASRVLVALHPSDVVASLTGGVSSLGSNLEWVREWALDMAMNDVDADCSMVRKNLIFIPFTSPRSLALIVECCLGFTVVDQGRTS